MCIWERYRKFGISSIVSRLAWLFLGGGVGVFFAMVACIHQPARVWALHAVFHRFYDFLWLCLFAHLVWLATFSHSV